jgi:ABC-2 type transport system permease protein
MPNKTWLIIKHEYLKIVRRRAFVLATIGIPLFFAAIMAISILTAVDSVDARPVGYVDQSGVLSAGLAPRPLESRPRTEFQSFADEPSARSALEAGKIQAYYVLPADYLKTQKLELYYWQKSPNDTVSTDLAAFIKANLVTGLPVDVQQRILDGYDITLRSADGSRQVDSTELVNVFLPFVVGLLFMFAVFTSTGYLLQAVATEKENRTIEVLMTSLTPGQLIGGKVIGLIAVALSQLVIWAIAIGVMLAIGGQSIAALRSIKIPPAFIAIAVLYFFPAYALIGGLMTAIGSSVTQVQQGQQIAGILNLLFTFPYFFVALFLTSPDSPLMVGLTLFPTTSFITVTMRWGLTEVPLWQLIASWLILMLTAVVSIWAATRIFRVGMLRYGQRLDLRGMLAAIRVRAQ